MSSALFCHGRVSVQWTLNAEYCIRTCFAINESRQRRNAQEVVILSADRICLLRDLDAHLFSCQYCPNLGCDTSRVNPSRDRRVPVRSFACCFKHPQSDTFLFVHLRVSKQKPLLDLPRLSPLRGPPTVGVLSSSESWLEFTLSYESKLVWIRPQPGGWRRCDGPRKALLALPHSTSRNIASRGTATRKATAFYTLRDQRKILTAGTSGSCF